MKSTSCHVVFVLVVLLATSSCAKGQHIGTIEHRPPQSWMKAENGLIISWLAGTVRDASAGDQITIADKQGQTVVSLNVLSIAPEATSVSIYDVSARQSQLIAVAVVYGKGPGIRPADALLLFDFKGTLVSALALEPSREVEALALDENLNVWTLTSHSDEKDPSQVPMVVEYDRNGRVIRESLSRDGFPFHAASIKQNPEISAVASGYSAGTFWFWLPGSTDLVVIRTSDGVVTRTQTNIPSAPQGQRSFPLRIARESSGTVIAEVREEGQDIKPHLAYYAWSPDTKSWSDFNPVVCAGHRLIGVDNDEHIYVRPIGSDICSYTRQ
jgi:hypothetical protein